MSLRAPLLFGRVQNLVNPANRFILRSFAQTIRTTKPNNTKSLPKVIETKSKSKELDPKQRVTQLRRLIRKYNQAYYNEEIPLVSDAEYDKLYDELVQLEKDHPEMLRSDSPTQTVGAKPKETTKRVIVHKQPMLSLSKAYTYEELKSFETTAKRLITEIYKKPTIEYVVEGKYDGVAVSLHYKDGVFIQALSRGDGIYGEDITQNVKLTCGKAIPQRIEPFYVIYKPSGNVTKVIKVNDFEIRGEMIMSRAQFDKMNAERQNLKLFKNARNLVAGLLRLDLGADSVKKNFNKDSSHSLVGKVNLSFIGYSLLLDSAEELDISKALSLDNARTYIIEQPPTHYDNIQIMKKLGFTPDKENKLCKTMDEVINVIEKWKAKRPTYEYVLDGLVIKINDLTQQEKCGQLARAPRWAIAYKFSAERVQTIVKGIILQVGRTGKITPVAELEPVDLGGTTISRATLNNFDYILKHNISVGSEVTVERSGDVIPKVTGNLSKEGRGEQKEVPVDYSKLEKFIKRNRDGRFVCPCSLEKPLTQPGGKTDFYCEYVNCQEQLINKIVHFSSRKALDIEGLSHMTVKKLLDNNFVKNIADLYDLHKKKKDLMEMDGWGQLKVNNLLKALEESKKVPWERVLYGIGIPHVGKETASLLAQQFPSLDHLIKASEWTLSSIPSIGDTIASGIYDFFHGEHGKQNRLICDRLKQARLQMEIRKGDEDDKDKVQYNKEKMKHFFGGKSVVITGVFSKFDREALKDIIVKCGGKVSNTISKSTDYLLIGQSAGSSKVDKAVELNIKTVNEEELGKIMN